MNAVRIIAVAAARIAALLVSVACVQANAEPTLQQVKLSQGYTFPLYANHSFDEDLSTIEAVVFVFHGARRDGDAYYAAAEKLAQDGHVDLQKTLIVAPNFFDTEDVAKHPELTDVPLWKGASWEEGAVAAMGPTVSSFAVIDDLLSALSDRKRLPKLSRIVIAGHSGGGQVVDRYAVLNHVDARLTAQGISISYVIANPSSYLYFTPDRPAGDRFAPYSVATCPAYDRYKFGMHDLVPYAAGVTASDAFKTFSARTVYFLWGTADTDPNHPALDKSCSAEAQGPARYARGHAYWRYLHLMAKETALSGFHAFDVEGVGHDQSHMLGSSCGSRLLFGDLPAIEGAARCTAVEPSS